MQYTVNAVMQIAQTRVSEKSQNKEELDTRLLMALRHTRLCTTHSAKFWRMISRAHQESFDTQVLMKTVRSIAHHEDKARDIFQDMMKQYPNNVKVLRAYGRFLVETRNDREAADGLLSLAESLEEEESKLHHPSYLSLIHISQGIVR